jgi:N-acetylmuramoyl-L-alanine amidase
VALALGSLAGAAAAQEAVRLLAADSAVEDSWGGIEVTLALTGTVPWRVFTLEDPRRIVVDLRGVAWEGGEPSALLAGENASGLRFGPVRGGWSRLVLELGEPMAVAEAGLSVEEEGARLRLVLEATSEEAFVATAGAPDEAPELAPPPPPMPEDGRFVVAIDPGHGGIDPGAERAGLNEADLMLALGLELSEAVERAGMVPVLTRTADVFVPLQERMTRARAGGADVLLSLHADALEEANAAGASVYTLTEEAVGHASARMVERHEGGDLIAGLDLRGQDDTVATALMDLARLDTTPRSERLAATLARALGQAGAAVNGKPLRQANLAVLKAADFPSVLLEAGFLSDAADRRRLSSPEGRRVIIAGIVAALEAWAAEEQAREALILR